MQSNILHIVSLTAYHPYVYFVSKIDFSTICNQKIKYYLQFQIQILSVYFELIFNQMLCSKETQKKLLTLNLRKHEHEP